MTTLFISDLHIDADNPAIGHQFHELIEGEGRAADALYILGDLFESWIGDDAPGAVESASIAAIRALTDSGVPCFVMRGNRDFLLGPGFCALSGARLVPDPLILTLYGERVLIMHGDALCIGDSAYQRLRATVRNDDWQRQFLALPVASRRALAAAARAGSRAHTAGLDSSIADVDGDAVAAVLRGAGVSRLVHGHTHRPAIHTLTVDSRACSRIVLGDWHCGASVLRWSAAGADLAHLPRREA